jgi:hypothetical protein
MTSQTKLTKDLIFKMVPQVTTKFNGRSKRAQQNIIYSSLAESMLDGEIKIDDNYWSFIGF